MEGYAEFESDLREDIAHADLALCARYRFERMFDHRHGSGASPAKFTQKILQPCTALAEGAPRLFCCCSRVAGQAQCHEGFPAQDSIRSTEEGRVPAILALLNGAVEQLRLASQGIPVRDVPKVLWSLDKSHFVSVEIAQDAVQEA